MKKFIFVVLPLLLIGCGQGDIIKPDSESDSAVSSAKPASMDGMVRSHNRIRESLNIPPLQWSDAIAAYAQEWADELASANNCQPEHRSGGMPYGENIYWASAQIWSDGRKQTQSISASHVVSSWAKEKQNYYYDSNSCVPGEMCGHYTQLVWKNSKNVGCGMSVCPNSAQIWVCNYDPAGNFIGQKPY